MNKRPDNCSPIYALALITLFSASCRCADDTKAEIQKKLQAKVSFDFADKPLVDAVKFISTTAKVKITIDPDVLKKSPPAITLKVTDMNADLALEWTLRLAELEYQIHDKEVFISTPAVVQAAKDKKP